MVPEHSVPFMEAMSGGEAFMEQAHLFFDTPNQLLAIGYPLEHQENGPAFSETLIKAIKRTRARNVSAICATLPQHLRTHRCSQDHYFGLPADTIVPPRLDRLASGAAGRLEVQKSTDFTNAHQQLWAEFTGRKPLPSDVYHLYAHTPELLPGTPQLMLFNAWDAKGHLAACLLIDSAPANFISYLLGAHSRTHYTPYATDLLFREMLVYARHTGKTYLHLGLGVNTGIRRFKSKWGGKPILAYEMARWREKQSLWPGAGELKQFWVSTSEMPVSKRTSLAALPQQRCLAMVWEVEKAGRRSLIVGTAHFFPYSFEHHLRSLFEGVDTVLFEGPLDTVSFEQVNVAGCTPDTGSPRLIDFLDGQQVADLIRAVCGPAGLGRLFSSPSVIPHSQVRHLLTHTRHWLAFFKLWSGYLARMGWQQSVDLEAWRLARHMDKAVSGMESIQEQIQTLDAIPIQSAAAFLQRCRQWPKFRKRYEKLYLRGDINRVVNETKLFPTRTRSVIFRRDALFMDYMRPYLESGRCAVFVGVPHLINLRRMLIEAGFNLRKIK